MLATTQISRIAVPMRRRNQIMDDQVLVCSIVVPE